MRVHELVKRAEKIDILIKDEKRTTLSGRHDFFVPGLKNLWDLTRILSSPGKKLISSSSPKLIRTG